jgi:hypothetical protein
MGIENSELWGDLRLKIEDLNSELRNFLNTKDM